MTSLSRLALLASLAFTSVLAGCSDDSSIGGTPGAGGGSAECTPGQQKKADDGCNDCFCQPNGYYACTEKACGGPGAGGTSGSAGTSGTAGSGQAGSGTAGTSGGQCKPGETRSVGDGCNTCICNPDGGWSCTLMDCTGPCMPQDASGEGECAMFIGYVWSGQACVGIGGCGCVGKDCGSVYTGIEACLEAHKQCTSGTECKSTDDCPQVDTPCTTNVCVGGKCQLTQTPGCGIECKPGETKIAPDGCNTCTCNDDGTWGGCTEIACNQKCETIADCAPTPPDLCSKVACENNLCVYSTVPGCGTPCAPQDAVGYGDCDGYFGVAWNGQECVGITGCGCKGADCKGLSFDPDECKIKHADCGSSNACQSNSDCETVCTTCNGNQICASGACVDGACEVPSFPPCAPGVTPGSKCEQPGTSAPAEDGCNTCTCGDDLTWGCTKIACGGPGSSCNSNADCKPVPTDGCMECGGINACGTAYCDTLPESGVCAVVPPSCGDSCEPQDIKGDGPCLTFIGVKWNGKECEGVGGCKCVGSECGQIYKDGASCQAVHQSCFVPF